jgi:hypothetical protein
MHIMQYIGSASGESSESRAYPLRSRGETVADKSRMADPLVAILKELRLMKHEMAANKAEFDHNLVDLTQEIRASTECDTASIARPHVTEAQRTILQPTEGTMAGAAAAQPVAEMPQTGGSGDSPGGNGGNVPIPKCQRTRFKAVTKWELAVNTSRHKGRKRQIPLRENLWSKKTGLKQSTFILQFAEKWTIGSCMW